MADANEGSEPAAILLSRHASTSPEARAAIARGLKASTASRFKQDEWLFGFQAPVHREALLAAPYDGELTAGTVVFAGPAAVLVRVGDENVLFKVASSGLTAGAAVQVGLTDGVGRVIVFTSADGQPVRLVPSAERGPQ